MHVKSRCARLEALWVASDRGTAVTRYTVPGSAQLVTSFDKRANRMRNARWQYHFGRPMWWWPTTRARKADVAGVSVDRADRGGGKPALHRATAQV